MLQIAVIELKKTAPFRRLEEYFLDTNDVSLSINFELADMTEVGRSRAPHTLTFSLPFTDRNDRQLTSYRQVNSTRDVNNTLPVAVYNDGERVLTGQMQVREADLQARKYKCVIYGEVADIYGKLRAASWVDIFTNPDGTISQALDHRKTAQNVWYSQHGADVPSSQWDITDGEVGEDVIWYPIQDTYQEVREGVEGNNYALSAQFVTNNQTGVRKWTAKSHVPSIQVSYLLQVIMQYAGFDLDMTAGAMSTTGDTPRFDKLYYLTDPANQTFRPYYGASGVGLQMFSLDGNISQPNASLFPTLYQLTGTSPNTTVYSNLMICQADPALYPQTYDPDNLFDFALGFSAPVEGTYIFNITAQVSKSVDIADSFKIGFSLVWYEEGSETNTNFVNVPSTVQQASPTHTLSYDIAITVGANGTIMPRLHWQGINFSYPVLFNVDEISLTLTSYIGDATVLRVPQSIGTEKVGEWFEALMTRWNLALDVDFFTGEAKILERAKLFNDDPSSAKDWTEKVDTTKPFVVKGNGDNLHREVIFKSAEGEEYATKYWNDSRGPFDEAVFRSTLQYAKGDTVIGEYFACPRFRRLPDNYNSTDEFYQDTINQSEKAIFVIANQRENNTEVEPRGHVPTFVYRGINRESKYLGATDELVLYDTAASTSPNASMRYTSTPQAYYGNRTLYYENKGSMDGVNHSTRNGLRVAAYGRELNDKYNTEQRVVTCELKLTSADIANLSYADVIRIESQLYYIDALRNYYVGQNRNVQAQLRKFVYAGDLNVALGTCELDIVDIEIGCNGLVTFTDSQGNEVDGSYGCCFYYGAGSWTWDAAQGRCYTGAQCNQDFAFGRTDLGAKLSSSNSYMDFTEGQIVYETGGDNSTQVITFQLQAETVTGGSVTNATDPNGRGLFVLPPNINLGFNVEYIVTDTSEANQGDVEFGTWTGVVRSIDFAYDKAASDDVTSRIGDSAITNFGVEGVTVNDQNYVRFYCGNITGTWTIQVSCEATLIDTRTEPVYKPLLTEAGEIVVTEDEDSILV